MLHSDNLAWLRRELGADFSAPRTVFEGLSLERPLLNGRNVLPSFVVARTVSTMHRVEDAKPRVARGMQDLQHMGNAVIRFRNTPDAVRWTPETGPGA